MTIHIRNKEPKTYIVLGMHQSGTSLVSKALQEQGIDMGNPNNSTFEDNKFVHLNNQILARAGGSWSNPPEKKNVLKVIKGMTLEIVSALKGLPFWGFKDPRTALTLDAYLPHLKGDPYLVCVFRKPEKVVNSLMTRDRNISKDLALGLTKHYNRNIIEGIEKFCEL